MTTLHFENINVLLWMAIGIFSLLAFNQILRISRRKIAYQRIKSTQRRFYEVPKL
jgi:hypothetical protein